jgi:hypothetical protein
MGAPGFEHTTKTPGNPQPVPAGGTDSGTHYADSANKRQPADPDLQGINEAWDSLPATVKASIMGLVKSAKA